MATANLARVRKICLSLPEAIEVEAWGSPTFRVGKIFAMYADADTHHGAGKEGVWLKTDHFTQDLLVRGQPTRYFSPPYVGPGGWTGVHLDANTDWSALVELLRDAWRATAPKKLVALIGDDNPTATPRAKAAPKKAFRKQAVAKRKSAVKRAKKVAGQSARTSPRRTARK